MPALQLAYALGRPSNGQRAALQLGTELSQKERALVQKLLSDLTPR